MKKNVEADVVSEEELEEESDTNSEEKVEDDSSKIKTYIENGKVRKKEKTSEEKEKKQEEKVYFTKRVFAFLIDVLLVSFIASLIATPFLDSKRVEELNNKAMTISEQLKNNEISAEDYVIQYGNLSYSIAREQGLVSILVILITILYFVVYQTYNNGQTLGKKLVKIKVESENDELTINQMIFRSFIINFLLLYIIDFIVMLTVSKSAYVYVIMLISFIQYTIICISALMMMFRKDGKGLHDLICRTKVVNVIE